MIKRRSEKIMMELILKIAENDERIRAVVINGSRASPSATKDKFQDYDIVYIVTELEPFVADSEWVKRFGNILIMQKPDEMDIVDEVWPKSKDSYGYLLQFKDWNRIDLTLSHINNVPNWHRDSQSILLLDKDHILGEYPPPSDSDYLPKPLTEKKFKDCCNEFLWCSNNVAKGIWRKELTYAKYMSENIVKTELIKLLTWHAEINTNFLVTTGAFGKYLEKYLKPEIWNAFTKTYVDANFQRMWDGLFEMCKLFNTIALQVSKYYGYTYIQEEYEAVVEYLQAVRKDMGN